jgi:hypothetical protein
MSYGEALETKLVNALVPDAEAIDIPIAHLDKVLPRILHRFKSHYGGLWVGGAAHLTATHLVFGPNAMNDAVHKDDTSFAIPLRDISAVAVEPGFLTNIIAMQTPERVYRIRCFGAQAFAERIRQRTGKG